MISLCIRKICLSKIKQALIFGFLLCMGINIEAGLMHDALTTGNWACVIDLINMKKCQADEEDTYGTSALHYATRFPVDQSVVTFLIQKGANVNKIARDYSTPLHNAVRNSDLAKIQLLLEAGALVNQPSVNNQTPLELSFKMAESIDFNHPRYDYCMYIASQLAVRDMSPKKKPKPFSLVVEKGI